MVKIVMFIMSKVWIIPLALMVVSCGLCKKCPQPEVIVIDSTKVEIHEHYVHDTARVEIPVEVEKIVTRDTTSYLENRLAVSEAVVSGGYLFHSLRTKPQTILVPVDVPVVDTTVYHGHTETVLVEREVEKKLTWWQKFRLNAFWWLVGLALVGWRREIVWLVKKIVGLF